VALSIVVHGVSATPLMQAHQRRRERARAGTPAAGGAPPSV
jgi:hypothetical protein